MINPVLHWLRKRCGSIPEQIKTVEDYHKRLGGAESPMLEDLRRFCFVYDTTFDDRPHRQQQNEGRREVYIHMVNMMNMDPKAIRPKPIEEEKDERDLYGEQKPTDVRGAR